MKAVLVVDVPDFLTSVTSGILKPIGTVGKLEISYGNDDGEMICYEFIDVDGLLLKPMPERKEFDNQIPYKKSGWNDCIDAILGEEE